MSIAKTPARATARTAPLIRAAAKAAPVAKAPRRRAPAPSRAGTSLKDGPDATALLRADHRHVATLFGRIAASRSTAKKRALVAEVCLALSVHAQVEEEILYPAAMVALADPDLVAEARVEHAILKELVGQIQDREPVGEMFDARVKVLSEYVKHHVRAEEDAMFPRLRRAAGLDLADLGARIAERQAALLATPALREAPDRPASPALAKL